MVPIPPLINVKRYADEYIENREYYKGLSGYPST